jgi:phosphate/sulfate permease
LDSEYVFSVRISGSELLLRFKIKHGSKEKAMALRKRVLIAVLVVALIAFAIVLTVASVLALLQSSVTVPSGGHIGLGFVLKESLLILF